MRIGACVAACMLAFPAAAAELPIVRPTPASNVIDFGSIRVDPIQSILLADGEWASSVTVSYMNQFNLSWHTRRVHTDRGLQRLPITREELRFLEELFGEDDIYLIDLEGWRADVSFSRGFPNGVTVTTEIPYIDIGGGPNLDDIAEEMHAIFTDVTFGRDVFPRGANVAYLHSDAGTYEALDASGSGFGDVTVSIAIPLRAEGFEQSVAFGVQLPTGDEGTLLGSGGWDLGARWFGKWRGERRSWLAGAGVSWLDPAGSFVGFDRDWTWSVLGEVVQRVKGDFWVRLGARIDSSPINDAFHESDLEDITTFYRLGAGYSFRDGSCLFFDLGEQMIPQTGVEADWTFHLGWSTRTAR